MSLGTTTTPNGYEDSFSQQCNRQRIELYIEQPEQFEEHGKPRKDFVCRLNKALYGLKQAGRLWYHTLHNHLTENRYKRLEAEPCVYTCREGEKVIIIAIYVDDINMASNDEALLQETRSEEHTSELQSLRH